MSPTGTSSASVDRYEVRTTWLGFWAIDLDKVVSGTRTNLGNFTGFTNSEGWIRLQMTGSAIKVYYSTSSRTAANPTWTLCINKTDSSITQVGRAGLCAAAQIAGHTWQLVLDNFYADGNFAAKTASDSTILIIEDGMLSKLVTIVKSGSDALGVNITEDPGTKDIKVLKDTGDTLDISITEGAPVFVKRYSMGIRAGLISDIDPYPLRTYWEASELMAAGVLNQAKNSGTTLSWLYDAGTGRTVLDVTSLDDDPFDPLLIVHPASMFASTKDQRGSFRIFATAQLLEGKPAFLRAAMKTPQTTLPLTQNPPSHAEDLQGGYRRLPIGVFTWPPAAGGAKYRQGDVAQDIDVTDLSGLALLQVEGLSENANSKSHLQISSIDLLPVESGYFSLALNKQSEQGALQQGEILVVDSIEGRGGGYVLKPSAAPATQKENIHLPSTTTAPISGGGIYLQPATSNCLVFLADRWSALDDLGENKEGGAFNAWIEYEPRYLFL